MYTKYNINMGTCISKHDNDDSIKSSQKNTENSITGGFKIVPYPQNDHNNCNHENIESNIESNNDTKEFNEIIYQIDDQ